MSGETRFVLEELLPVLATDPDSLDDKTLFALTLDPSEAALGVSGCGDTVKERIGNTFYGGFDTAFHRETVKGLQDMIRHSGDRKEWACEALEWVVPTVVSWDKNRQLFQLAPKNFHYEKDPVKRAWLIRGWWVFQVARAFDAQYPGKPSNGAVFIGNCPRCGTIFKRKNTRQVFCRDYCQKNPDAKPRSGPMRK